MVELCISCMAVPILVVVSIIYFILECLGLKSKTNEEATPTAPGEKTPSSGTNGENQKKTEKEHTS